MDAQLSRFPAQAGQLASPTDMYFVYINTIGSNFLLKKKKNVDKLKRMSEHTQDFNQSIEKNLETTTINPT
jgi:hypothetical protein